MWTKPCEIPDCEMISSKAMYKRWSYDDMADKFVQRRTWDTLFDSEKHFLAKIQGRYDSVLDVGCAFGGMSEVFCAENPRVRYTGVDVSERVIAEARRTYRDQFLAANFIDMDLTERYDLVFSTGVCQHEPRYQELIARFVQSSNKYVLFDCKLSPSPESLVDIERAYCDYEDPLYFVLLNPADLIGVLSDLPGIAGIDVYGYYTGIHEKVVLPDSVDRVCSCHVLLTKASRIAAVPEYGISLPEELAADTKRAIDSIAYSA